MVAAYRSSTSGGSAAATSYTLNVPAGIADGDVLIAVVHTDNRSSDLVAAGTIPTGWTLEASIPGETSGNHLFVYSRVVASAALEPATHTFAVTVEYVANFGMSAFSGVDTSTIWDAPGTTTTSGSSTVSTVTTSGVTTALADSMVVSVGGFNSPSGTLAPSPATLAWDTSGRQGVSLGYLAMPTPGVTGDLTWTFSAAKNGFIGYDRALRSASTSIPTGTATGTLTVAGAAAGTSSRSGVGVGVLVVAGAASGATLRAGQASGTIAGIGAATGSATHQATATGTIAFVGIATGTTTRHAVAVGTLTAVGAAAGVAPPVDAATGHAVGELLVVGVAHGVTAASGSSVGEVAFVGAAFGGGAVLVIVGRLTTRDLTAARTSTVDTTPARGTTDHSPARHTTEVNA